MNRENIKTGDRAMNQFVDLTGRKILITGASSGIGKQTALTLNGLGADVILVARREERLKAVLSELEGENNAYYVSDLSEVNRIEHLFKQIAEEQGKLDGMVYAAGIAMSMPLKLFKPEKMLEIFNINYFGFIESVRQICKKGRFNEGMRIVGVSSVASMQGDKAHLAYSGSKAAMDASVRCIAREMADKGVCINTVAPAMTETEMYLEFIKKDGGNSQSGRELMVRQYMGLGKPEDIANAIAFLISPAARFITGITLPVDGGMTTT